MLRSRFWRELRRGGVLLPVLLLCCACSGPRQPVEIAFVARFGSSAIDCTRDAEGVRLSDLRLFVHDLRLLTPAGSAVPVTLPDRAPWQGEQVALLDFEDGQGPCRNGSAETNTVVHGLAPPGEFTGLSFRLGVPADLNHANPLQARPPLNFSSMHWHWLTGYKFLRAGFVTDHDGFWLHLGSTRCEGTAAAPAGCASPNRPEVVLADFDAGRDAVVFDLQVLAAVVDLADGIPTDCSSGPAEAACERPFATLGLDFGSGRATGTPGLVTVTKNE